MGSRASTLLREEEIEEIKKETGCKLANVCDEDEDNDTITLAT